MAEWEDIFEARNARVRWGDDGESMEAPGRADVVLRNALRHADGGLADEMQALGELVIQKLFVQQIALTDDELQVVEKFVRQIGGGEDDRRWIPVHWGT